MQQGKNNPVVSVSRIAGRVCGHVVGFSRTTLIGLLFPVFCFQSMKHRNTTNYCLMRLLKAEVEGQGFDLTDPELSRTLAAVIIKEGLRKDQNGDSVEVVANAGTRDGFLTRTPPGREQSGSSMRRDILRQLLEDNLSIRSTCPVSLALN